MSECFKEFQNKELQIALETIHPISITYTYILTSNSRFLH
jgi:hypothetical protein